MCDKNKKDGKSCGCKCAGKGKCGTKFNDESAKPETKTPEKQDEKPCIHPKAPKPDQPKQ